MNPEVGASAHARKSLTTLGWVVRCLAPVLLLLVAPGRALAQQSVVVFTSDELAVYEPAVEGFSEVMGEGVVVWNLQGSRERADDLVAHVRAHPPDLLLALGAKAAFVAAHDLDEIPTIYAMVRDPDRYGINGPQITGIGSDIPAETALSQFKLFVPQVETVGVMLGSRSGMERELSAAAEATGVHLRIERVADGRALRATYAELAREMDALWIVPDPQVVTPDNFHFLRERCRRAEIPIFASSEALVHAGALLAVVPDYHLAGLQAGDLAHLILGSGTRPGEIPPLEPQGMRVVLNRDTLDDLGLQVDDMLLDFTDEVVGESRGR